MADNPLIDLGKLSEPATKLVEKISDAVGGLYRPRQIVRVAEAEAEAARIRAAANIEVTDLQRRALHRFLEEEGARQSNMESITSRALPLLQAGAEPQQVENDWLTNFFEKSRIVSDDDMQQIWAAILAGEANTPGTFSRKTVNLLGDLDRRDAELFTSLCGFVWLLVAPTPLIVDLELAIYKEQGIRFSSLQHLETLGLIQVNPVGEYGRTNLPKFVQAYYYGRRLLLTLPKDTKNHLLVGKVLLTQAGLELYRICKAPEVNGFFEFMRERWQQRSYIQAGSEDQPSDSAKEFGSQESIPC